MSSAYLPLPVSLWLAQDRGKLAIAYLAAYVISFLGAVTSNLLAAAKHGKQNRKRQGPGLALTVWANKSTVQHLMHAKLAANQNVQLLILSPRVLAQSAETPLGGMKGDAVESELLQL